LDFVDLGARASSDVIQRPPPPATSPAASHQRSLHEICSDGMSAPLTGTRAGAIGLSSQLRQKTLELSFRRHHDRPKERTTTATGTRSHHRPY
jgi:hypothetical protein